MVKRLIACMLMVCLIMSGGIISFGAWDGYIEKSGAESELIIVDMNKIGNIMGAGIVPSEKIKGRAQQSAWWADMVATKDIRFKNVPRNWSGCDTIVLPVYSKKATGTDFMFCVFCDAETDNGKTTIYYSYRITLDWEGWRTFEISLSNDMARTNGPDISKVNYIRITNDGWNCTASAEAQVYFDTIYAKRDAVAGDNGSIVKLPYTPDDAEAFKEALGDGCALVEYNRNVFTNEKTEKFDENNKYAKVLTKGDTAYVPESFFKKYFGKAAGAGEDAFTESGINFVPVLKKAEELGIPAGKYGKMYVLGENVNFEAIAANEETALAGAYTVCAANEITDEVFDELRKRWRYNLVGDENNDTSSELVKKAIDAITKNANSAWDTLKGNKGNGSILFSAVTTTAHMTDQYKFLGNMAKAYGTKGSELYKDKKLRRDIINGLDFLYENYYGDDEMNRKGWRDTSLYNWYDWACGVPGNMMDILMIMYDEVSEEQIVKWTEPVKYIIDLMVNTSQSRGESAMSSGGMGYAILRKDVEMFNESIKFLDDRIQITEPRVRGINGIKEDGTYIMHEDFTYNGSYAVDLIAGRALTTLNLFADTSIDAPTPNSSNMLLAAYEVFEPILHNGGIMSLFMGRSPDKSLSVGCDLVSRLIKMVGLYGEENDIKIKTMIKRNVSKENIDLLSSYLGVKQAEVLNEILNDESIDAGNDYERAKIYYNGDKAVWHSNGYAAGLSMYSERQAAWESINGINKDGWYMSDGALYVYSKEQYQQFGSGWWGQRNPYHMPGTTVDTQVRQVVSVDHSEDYVSSQDFVGGAELSGQYMTAAMALESFHNSRNTGKQDEGYGGAMPLHNSTLTAKKSYFFFDDEIVAMGSDINANDGYEVKTVVDNRKLFKKGINDEGLKEIKIARLMSAGDDGNVIDNVIDDNLDTRWSLAGNEDCWFTAELDEETEIGYAGIAFYGTEGSTNYLVFDLDVSNDGINWETIYSGQSLGKWGQMEAFDLKNTKAKYIRYNGYGRLNGVWNSITEFKLYPPSEDGSMVTAFSDEDATVYGTEDITVNGELMEKVNGYDKEIENPRFVHLENVGGYYFPNTNKLFVKKTDSFNSFLEMWVSHGVSPEKGSYCYAVLPNKSASETAAYSENPDIEILSNTEKLQAVREKKTNSCGMVFWEAGTLDKISTDSPIICMMKEDGGELILSVSDPTGKLTEANIKVSGRYEVVSKNERMTALAENEETKIAIDFTNSLGKSLELKLKAN